MNKHIRTYDDLLVRKKYLESLLQEQKELIQLDIEELKADAEPLLNTISSVSDFFTRNKKAWVLGLGVNSVIDFLVKDVILSKSGWITKLIIPFFIKNFSSHFIAEHQEEWLKNITEWLGYTNGHHKEETVGEPEEEEKEE